MTEMERFESRFEAALGRLADEVPTVVDASEVARSIAAREARRGWLRGPLAGTRPYVRLAGVGRLAFAAVLLLLLSFGFFALAQRIDPTPAGEPLTGRLD
jgi:hypothetical protein